MPSGLIFVEILHPSRCAVAEEVLGVAKVPPLTSAEAGLGRATWEAFARAG